MEFHTPVLATETITALDVKENGIYIDATLGHGGHTLEILKKGGIVYGFDQDPTNLQLATTRIKAAGFESKFFPIHANFIEIESIAKKKIGQKVDGLIADLGLSQSQQVGQGRGFSFNDDLSLDMRLDPENQELTAENIINTCDYDELFEIFTKLAQEQYAKPLILKIIRERQKKPITTGSRLADIIREYYNDHHLRSKIDPSTKIFLALRIYVNDESTNLKKILFQSLNVVKKDGVVAIITFHSGEDRIVKQFIRDHSLQKLVIENKKSAKASFVETKTNPLSRSATLRSYKII